MAFLGRDSEARTRRAERFHQWYHARSPFAVVSVPLGIMAVIDVITVVLGIALGIAAISVAVRGHLEIKSDPSLLGRRLYLTGGILGALGIMMSVTVWLVFY